MLKDSDQRFQISGCVFQSLEQRGSRFRGDVRSFRTDLPSQINFDKFPTVLDLPALRVRQLKQIFVAFAGTVKRASLASTEAVISFAHCLHLLITDY